MNKINENERIIKVEGLKNHSSRIAPREFKNPVLIAQLADGWVARSEALSFSASANRNYVAVIRSVGKFIEERGRTNLEVSGAYEAVLLNEFYEWELWLMNSFSKQSNRPLTMGITLRNILQTYMYSGHGDSDKLKLWAYGDPLAKGISSGGHRLDELSPQERKDLQNVCKNLVREAEVNLQQAEFLLSRGMNPLRDGWDKAANVVWGLYHLPEETLKSEQPSALRSRKQANQLLEQDLGKLRPDSYRGARDPFQSFFGPAGFHLTAFYILILFKTGWSPEEVKYLRKEDVTFSDSEVSLRLVKNRASRIRTKTLLTHARSDSYGWTAGDLFRRAERVMRFYNPDDKATPWFWETVSRKRGILKPQIISNDFKQAASLRSLVERTGINISEPFDFRRIRKTVASIRAVVAGDLASSASGEHTADTFEKYYSKSSTLKVLSAVTACNAQQKVFDEATGPIVVRASATEVSISDGSEKLTNLAAAVAQENETVQLDVTACSDPYNAPFGPANELCMEAPRYCLQCRNAVVFKDHLPRILTYRSYLNKLKFTMVPAQFQTLYMEQVQNIEAILELFTEAEIAAAETCSTELRLPIEMKGAHQ